MLPTPGGIAGSSTKLTGATASRLVATLKVVLVGLS